MRRRRAPAAAKETRQKHRIAQDRMDEKTPARKWSSAPKTFYGLSHVKWNSCNETVKRGIMQDRPHSRLGNLVVSINVFPERRDHLQHPDRRCEQDCYKQRCFS